MVRQTSADDSNVSDHAATHGHATAVDVLFGEADYAGQDVREADAADVLFGEADKVGELTF